jgi:hypothetical protein
MRPEEWVSVQWSVWTVTRKVHNGKEYVNSETRTVFWEVKLCSLLDIYRYFGGTCFHLQGQRISWAIKEIVFLHVKLHFMVPQWSHLWKIPNYSCGKHFHVGFEVLTSVITESSVFWDMTPCSPLKVNRRFGGGDIFLRNVDWLSMDYTALYSRRYNSSSNFMVNFCYTTK